MVHFIKKTMRVIIHNDEFIYLLNAGHLQNIIIKVNTYIDISDLMKGLNMWVLNGPAY